MDLINQKTKDMEQGAIREMFDRASAMEDVISLGIGEPDIHTDDSICRAAYVAMLEGYTHYTPNAGIIQLRSAIANETYLKGAHYDPATEVIVTCGGAGAISTLMAVIIDPGDEVLIQDPQWFNYVSQVEYYGGKAIRVPAYAENGFELDAKTISHYITEKTKALMINSPNNPTGRVISYETAREISHLAVERDFMVISDDVYNSLLYTGEDPFCIAEMPGMKERTVIIGSFSKSYAMTGWRIGYAAGPAEVIDRMTKCQEIFTACASSMGQWAAVYALKNPQIAEKIKDIFDRRRRLIMSELSKIDGLRFAEPQGAFYVFADISAFGLSDTEFCNKLLDEEHVVCIPGSPFGEQGRGCIRIAYTIEEEKLVEAVGRIKAFCDRLR